MQFWQEPPQTAWPNRPEEHLQQIKVSAKHCKETKAPVEYNRRRENVSINSQQRLWRESPAALLHAVLNIREKETIRGDHRFKEICEFSHIQSPADIMCADLCLVILHNILILMTAAKALWFCTEEEYGPVPYQRLWFCMACVQIPFKVSIMREALAELMWSVNNVEHKSAEAGAKLL